MDNIKVLFEDENIMAISKPAGVAVHHDGKTEEYVITDWLLQNVDGIESVGEPLILNSGEEVSRPGVVHRLDKDTSGVLLIAKTSLGYTNLKKQFQSREIKKTYHTFVYGRLRDERGIIDKPIGRALGSVRKWATGSKARGEMREAVTRYKVIGNNSSSSFLEVWPLTGRTHQIRVHMLSIGHPVVSDSLYAKSHESLLGFSRLALHASRVVFKDIGGKVVEVEAPFPPDFVQAMEAIKLG